MKECAFCGQSCARIENRRKMVVWPNNRSHTISLSNRLSHVSSNFRQSPRNVSVFNKLFLKYGSELHENAILHHSTSDQKTYLFYDSAHLLKNVQNNLLNFRQFIFSRISFF